MYSIVLVAAMTAAPATPDFFFKHGGCYGCNGCSGYSAGCCGGGYGYGGCCGGWGYGGCCGGGWGHSWGCHGTVTVYSSCCGGGCCGGWGHYPVGPYGGLAYSGCCGGQPYYTGCSGYGNYYVPAGPVSVGYGYSNLTVPTAGYPVGAVPAGAFVSPVPSTAVPVGLSTSGIPEAISSIPATRAQVVVVTSADAKLYADGQATSLTGAQRTFLTPELTAGRDFQYSLKIENGTETSTKSVVVRAGHRTVVDFTTPTTDKVSSTVTINLPAKAKLFVDGVSATVAGGTQTFRTPELKKGQSFVYDLRAELETTNGQPEVVSKKVTFKAGEPVTVDFNVPTTVATR